MRYLIDSDGENPHVVNSIASFLLRCNNNEATVDEVILKASEYAASYAACDKDFNLYENIFNQRIGVERLLSDIRNVTRVCTSNGSSGRFIMKLCWSVGWSQFQVFMEYRRDD